jgi:hypothetical protein
MSVRGQFATPTTMTTSEDLYDFGVRTHVTPSSDDLVLDLSSLAGSGS